MTGTPFIIHKTEVSPGENAIIKLPVGRIPSGTQIAIQVYVFRSTNPGPCMLILGGVHGDEINGVEVVRRTIQQKLFEHLDSGSVIVIPLLNIYGFINFSRDVPDGKDVNRSFPGSNSGSLASRVARVLTKKILPYIDFGVDFHTGGRNNYNFPQIRFSKGHEASEKLAEAFGAPFQIGYRPIPKSLRKVATDQEKPMLVFEGGESLRFDALSIQRGLEGIKRLLVYKGMKAGELKPTTSIQLEKTTWVRAGHAGLFLWYKSSGNKVWKDEPLGVIGDPFGIEQHPVYAPRTGYIFGHNNGSVVSQGDALFHIGEEI